MSAVKTIGALERQDKMLYFGKTGTLSTSAVPFGYNAGGPTDGVRIDTGDTDLEGAAIIIQTVTAITASGSPTATDVVIELKAYNAAGSSDSILKQTIPAASFVVGSPIAIPIPRGYASTKTILALTADVDFTAGTTPAVTAGELEAWIDCYAGAI